MFAQSKLPMEIQFGTVRGFLPDYQFRTSGVLLRETAMNSEKFTKENFYLGDSYFKYDNSEEDFFLGQLEKNGLESFKNPNEQLEIVIRRLERLYVLVTT